MTNIAELDRVPTFIKDNPEKHDQSVWSNDCGTAACVAVWACLLNGYSVDAEEIRRPTYSSKYSIDSYLIHGGPVIDGRGHQGHIRELGADILDLTSRDAEVLFCSDNTIDQLELMVKDLANGDELHTRWEPVSDGFRRIEEAGL